MNTAIKNIIYQKGRIISTLLFFAICIIANQSTVYSQKSTTTKSISTVLNSMPDDSNKVNFILKECHNSSPNKTEEYWELVSELEQIATQIHDNPGLIQAYIFYSDYYYFLGNLDTALINIRTAKRKSLEHNITSFLFEINLKEAKIHEARNDLAGEKDSYKRALAFSIKQSNTFLTARAYQLTGERNLRLRELFPAIVHLKKAITLFRTEKDYLNLTESLASLSDVYILKEEYSLALICLDEIIELVNKVSIPKSSQIHIFINQGLASFKLEKYIESRTYFLKAEKLKPSSAQTTTIYNHLFLIYNHNNNTDKQSEYLIKLTKLSPLKNSQTSFLITRNKGIYYNNIGKCDSAIALNILATKISDSLGKEKLSKALILIDKQQDIELKRAYRGISSRNDVYEITKEDTLSILTFVFFISLILLVFSFAYTNILPKQLILFSFYLLGTTSAIIISIQLVILNN